jgi:uncharacterized membrane protein
MNYSGLIWITYIIIFLSFFILSILSSNLKKQNQFFNNYFTKTILYISCGLLALLILFIILYPRNNVQKSDFTGSVFIGHICILIAISYIFYFINSSDDDDNDNKNNTKQIIFSVSLWCVTGIMFLCMVGLGYAYLETARLIEIFSGPFVKKIPHKTGYKN